MDLEGAQCATCRGAGIAENTEQYRMFAPDSKEYIAPDLAVAEIVVQIHEQEAAAIACHPHYKKEVDYQPISHRKTLLLPDYIFVENNLENEKRMANNII